MESAGSKVLMQNGHNGRGCLPPVGRALESEYYPLSSQQQRLFFITKLAKDDPLLNLCFSLRLDGILDIVHFEKALNTVINRHSVLRTLIMMKDGIPVQRIVNNADIKLKILDFTEYPESLREFEADRVLSGEAKACFDVNSDVLLRLTLIKVSNTGSIFVINLHHLIADGISIQLFKEELIEAYNANARGEKNPLPEVELQYRDYALWQHELVNSNLLGNSREYWMKEFSGELPVLDLPADFARTPFQSYKGSRYRITLDNELKRKIETVSFKNKVLPFAAFLGAYYILLYKYSGQKDIIIGSIFNGRHNSQHLSGSIGFYANTVALRLDLSGNPSIKTILDNVQKKIYQVSDNQDYPLERIIQDINIKRDLSQPLLFQVMFNMQRTAVRNPKWEGLEEKEWKRIETGSAQYDLTMHVFDDIDTVSIEIEYCTDLFRKETIFRMAEHYKNILLKLVDDCSININQLDILSSGERSRLLEEYNNTYRDFPQDMCIHQLFEKQVKETPGNIAVVFEDAQVTYSELNSKSNCLAAVLRESGIKPDDAVALVIDRSIDMISGILGTLKAGGAYLPVDISLPVNRIKFMLEDSAARCILIQKRLLDKFQDLLLLFQDRTILVIEDIIYNQENAQNMENVNNPDDTAYIIYTSGSTGRPKGVALKHAGIANLKIFFEQSLGIGSKDRVVQFARTCFDASVWESFMSLLTGAALYIVPDDIVYSGRSFESFLNENGITVATLPPTYICILNSDNIKTLRKLIAAGSESRTGEVNRWIRRVEYINAYGPTETTICATAWKARSDEIYGDNVPIGKPIFNTKAYILDDSEMLVPVGVPGELCFSGVSIAKGYLNRPDLTKQKFIVNPFDNCTILYKTGDKARFREDGNIEFLGRLDQQVKIRGFRVETGEVENRLLQHEKINEAIVTVRKDEKEDTCLCAYFTSAEDIPFSELQEFLLQELPGYMVPSFFIHVDKMPLTPSGKIDKERLPNPSVKSEKQYSEPGNKLERTICDIWGSILNTTQIGIHDNFFDIGGNSLIFIQVCDKLGQETGREVSVASMFKYPTISSLAEYLSRQETGVSGAEEPVGENFCESILLDTIKAMEKLDYE